MCCTESPYLSSQLAPYFIPAPYSPPLPTSKDCSLGWWGSWGKLGAARAQGRKGQGNMASWGIPYRKRGEAGRGSLPRAENTA